jgi:hypothetical protein
MNRELQVPVMPTKNTSVNKLEFSIIIQNIAMLEAEEENNMHIYRVFILQAY